MLVPLDSLQNKTVHFSENVMGAKSKIVDYLVITAKLVSLSGNQTVQNNCQVDRFAIVRFVLQNNG